MPDRDPDRERLADAALMTGGDDLWDARTHIERINGDGNPAAIPGLGVYGSGDPATEAETFTENQS